MVGAMGRIGAVERVVRRIRLQGQGLHAREGDRREEMLLVELMLLLLLLLLVMLVLELDVRQRHGVLLDDTALFIQQVVDPHDFTRCRRFHIVQ